MSPQTASTDEELWLWNSRECRRCQASARSFVFKALLNDNAHGHRSVSQMHSCWIKCACSIVWIPVKSFGVTVKAAANEAGNRRSRYLVS